MVLYSHAKLNLYLEVINKRRDNYHNIDTVFERISLCDKIVLKSRPDKKIKIICDHPQVPRDRSNFCYLSAKLLQDNFKVDRGVDIEIVKRIPVGAGLGGGSSNAAAVLLGLNGLWKLRLSREKLVKLSARIGSDAAFFIYNIPFAQGASRGNKIKPLTRLSRLRLWHILIVPRIKVSTAVIYRKWDMLKGVRSLARAGLTRVKYSVKLLTLALEQNDLDLINEALFNDLEQVSVKLYPQIRWIKEWLIQRKTQPALMSGSGPAVFAVCASRKEAVSLYRELKRENRAWRVFVARTI